jgi:hypothetical protein
MLHRLKYFALTSALVLALTFSFQRTAYAYVDPGSGLLAFQSFSAVITGALFYFRSRLKSVFQKASPPSPAKQEKTL